VGSSPERGLVSTTGSNQNELQRIARDLGASASNLDSFDAVQRESGGTPVLVVEVAGDMMNRAAQSSAAG